MQGICCILATFLTDLWANIRQVVRRESPLCLRVVRPFWSRENRHQKVGTHRTK